MAFFINLGEKSALRSRQYAMITRDMYQMTEALWRSKQSELTRFHHPSPRNSARCLYLHQVRRSNDEGATARHIEPGNNVWSAYAPAVHDEPVLDSLLHERRTKTEKEEKKKTRRSPTAGW